MYYQTTIYLGSNSKNIDVIIDGSTSNTYVSTDECSSCKYQKFFRSASTTLKYKDSKQRTVTEYQEIYYPKLNRFIYSGQYYYDWFCLDKDKNHCAVQGQFFGAAADPGFDEGSGILGLKLTDDRSNIIEQLKDTNVISKGMAGLYIEDDLNSGYKSQLRIGGYNSALMGGDGESNVVWWPLIDNTAWKLNVIDAKLGTDSFFPEGASI